MPPPIRLGALARFLVLSMLALLLVCFLPDLAAAQEVAAPPEGSVISPYLRVILDELGAVIFPVLSAALTALVGGLIHLVARRLGVEKAARELGLYELSRKIAHDAVARAEHKTAVFVREGHSLPDGAQKLQWALDFAIPEAKRRGLAKWASDEIVKMIEARLGDPDSPGGSYRADSEILRLRGAEVDA